MSRAQTLTADQSWDLLREFCNAVNGDDFAKVQELTEANLEQMQECHFEALLEGITLTREGVEANRPFLTRVNDYMNANKVDFASLRSAMRAGMLETLLDTAKDA